MKILVTGAHGFVGKNLCATLGAVAEDGTVYAYDADTDPALLDGYCRDCDFVFHLAGVNRPQDPAAFVAGNVDFTAALLDTLRRHGNTCPVLFSSSTQATQDNPYGRSKKAGEDLLFAYGEETGADVLVYRLPNVFGKWCRPNYNSAVATFCHHIAHDLPIQVDDPATALTLTYIDDVVEEFLRALRGVPTRDGGYCRVPVEHKTTLGEVVDLIDAFHHRPSTLMVPEIPAGSLAKKLYSTYLSYLPADKVLTDLPTKTDNRGSFTEWFKTASCGQVSINVTKPGVTKGQHWHHTKWEMFAVVSGEGRVEQRKIGTDEVLSFDVSGDRMQVVTMLPGYTHSLTNRSHTRDLVTLTWANEPYDPTKPDTFSEEV